MNENAGTVTLTVTLSNPMPDVVTVNYATSDNTAVAGTDYTASSGTVTFPAGVTSQTIGVGIIDNGSYTDQAVYFTVTLSNPSPNVILGTVIAAIVDCLDNDPAPTVNIEISGVLNVPVGQKQDPGGYVQVNANNDNGSRLAYADGTLIPNDTTGKPVQPGIPQMRDYDAKNVKLAAADPDLLQITLATTGLKAGGSETIVLSVSISGHAKIQLWDTGKKNNPIAAPTNWTAATMPTSAFVEGLQESAALKEITLTLQIKKGGTLVAMDTCVLTVTPVLTAFAVTAAKNASPNIVNDTNLGWAIDSVAGIPDEAVTETASAQWTVTNKTKLVRGSLYFIQTWQNVNNLKGGFGADIGTGKTYDFGAPAVEGGATPRRFGDGRRSLLQVGPEANDWCCFNKLDNRQPCPGLEDWDGERSAGRGQHDERRRDVQLCDLCNGRLR